MLTVHHLNNSRSQRVLWLLEELGAEYEIVRHERDKQTMLAPPSLKAVHPLGKSPVIVDGELTLAETGPIMEYILDKYGEGRLTPAKGDADYWPYRYWMHYAEGSAMPPLVMKLVMTQIPKRAPFFMKPFANAILGKAQKAFVDPQLVRHADYWEAAVQDTGWFAGEAMTAADIMMSFPVEAGAQRAGYDSRPALKDFLKRIHARPAYKAALEKGGPYAYA